MKAADRLSHLDKHGRARMVDVSAKPSTVRRAVASAVIELGPRAYRAVFDGKIPKGDVLGVARLAGIQAAKRTSELIPLCHGLAPDAIQVEFEARPHARIRVSADVRVRARTGVEMEALVAVTVAALTVYDMCKAVSKGIRIGPVQLELKAGGKSGKWVRAKNDANV